MKYLLPLFLTATLLTGCGTLTDRPVIYTPAGEAIGFGPSIMDEMLGAGADSLLTEENLDFAKDQDWDGLGTAGLGGLGVMLLVGIRAYMARRRGKIA